MGRGETKVTKGVRSDLEGIGATVEKVSDRFRLGVSDLAVCYLGFYFKLEVKDSEDAEYTTIQCLHLVEHHRGGGVGFFVHPENWEYLFGLIKEMPVTLDRLRRYGEVQVQALIQKKQIKNPGQKDFNSSNQGQQKQKRQRS